MNNFRVNTKIGEYLLSAALVVIMIYGILVGLQYIAALIQEIYSPIFQIEILVFVSIENYSLSEAKKIAKKLSFILEER